MRALRPYHLLALLPALGLLGGLGFANRVRPLVLGLPFLLFWIVAWVVATSALMALLLALDTRRERAGPAAAAAAMPNDDDGDVAARP
jgi:hypothetical protein